MRALHALILGAWILGASGCTAKPCPECPPCPQPHPQEAASAASARITPGSTSGAPSESAAAAAAENNPEERTPEKCRLYHLVSEYETVIFDHRSHEGYADDCETCHHHASSVEHTPPCRECHGLSSDDLDRPGLKGAYHRQCMNCHREMGSGPMGCEDCHAKLPVGDRPSPERLAREAAPQKMRLGHLAREYSGVDFDHRLHTELTEGCAQCHHKQKGLEVAPPCRECHNTPENLKAAYHEQCIGCHRKDDQGPTDCSDCHATK